VIDGPRIFDSWRPRHETNLSRNYLCSYISRPDSKSADVKPVQKACGTAYLAVLKAIDKRLLSRGLSKKELPRSVDSYTKALKKYLTVRNGKLVREFERLYNQLHIAGYYRTLLHNVDILKHAIKAAELSLKK
jgi:hypothetical protein